MSFSRGCITNLGVSFLIINIQTIRRLVGDSKSICVDVAMKSDARSGSQHNNSQLPDGSRQSEKKESKISTIKEYFIDYSLNSSLHGVRYMGERQRTIIEKLFWVFIFTVCLVTCCNRIAKVWKKWDESPVIVSFAEDFTPIWKIPFPAVTLCHGRKFSDVTFSDSEIDSIREAVNLLCASSIRFVKPTKEISSGNETIVNLKKAAPDRKRLFKDCYWKGGLKNCTDIFHEVVTQDGICYTFNGFGREELFRMQNIKKDYNFLELINSNSSWTLDAGYHSNTPLETYPHRGTTEISDTDVAGLLVPLLAKKHWSAIHLACRGLVQEFKIYLHNPAELPNTSRPSYKVSLAKIGNFVVKPKVVTTSEGLRDYPIERRKCYFQDQRYLRYFKVYTKSNCEMECLNNYTMAVCGCVHFALPHDQNMPVCGLLKWECMNNAKINLLTIGILSELAKDNETFHMEMANKVALECKCYPACTSIEYEAEVTESDFNWTATAHFVADGVDQQVYSTYALTYVRVLFQNPYLLPLHRVELYGLTDFLANCGGLLGLFIGFSILSVAEIFYFLTLRLYSRRTYTTEAKNKSECSCAK